MADLGYEESEPSEKDKKEKTPSESGESEEDYNKDVVGVCVWCVCVYHIVPHRCACSGCTKAVHNC